MHFQNLLAAAHIRLSDIHFSIKTTGTKQRRIQNIHTVRSRHNDDAFVDAEAVHLHKELVEGLLSLVVTAAHAGTAATSHRINLINKHDARCMPLRIGKHIPDTGRTYTDKHLYKIRTGNGEKRHAGLTGYRLGNQRLTGSGRAHQKHTLRNPGTQLRVFLRCLQEIDHAF